MESVTYGLYLRVVWVVRTSMQVSLQEKQKVNIKLYKAVPCCFLFIACITGIIFGLFYNMLINDEHIKVS